MVSTSGFATLGHQGWIRLSILTVYFGSQYFGWLLNHKTDCKQTYPTYYVTQFSFQPTFSLKTSLLIMDKKYREKMIAKIYFSQLVLIWILVYQQLQSFMHQKNLNLKWFQWWVEGFQKKEMFNVPLILLKTKGSILFLS